VQRQILFANVTKFAALMQVSTEEDRDDQPWSIFDRIKILVQDFIHSEHVDFVLLEHFAHRFVADDIPLVRWIL